MQACLVDAWCFHVLSTYSWCTISTRTVCFSVPWACSKTKPLICQSNILFIWGNRYILDWPKCLFSFFLYNKRHISHFTNNFIDLNILSMSAISHVVCCWMFSVNVSTCVLSTSTGLPTMGHCPARNLEHTTSETTFDTFNPSQHLFHRLHQSFLCISVVFLPFLI